MAELDLTEAIEAAAKVLAYEAEEDSCDEAQPWDAATEDYKTIFRLSAREVLTAALPAIEHAVREKAAQELLAAGSDPHLNLAWMYPEQAATIVRRGSLGGSAPIKTAPAADIHDASGLGLKDYGTATTEKRADGTVVVLRADPLIGITRDLLEQLGRDGLHQPGGRIWLDSAGDYEYTFHGDIPSPQGFRHDVLLYQRLHRDVCYETSPVECDACKCWCHSVPVGPDTTEGKTHG